MPPLTVRQLIELLHQYPEDAVVLVEGYETGWDVIHALRKADIIEHWESNDWDGEYQETSLFNQTGRSRQALLIEGRRGHRRGSADEFFERGHQIARFADQGIPLPDLNLLNIEDPDEQSRTDKD